jgi:hypothetical protein
VPNWSDEQTDNPLYAADRNFYKLEKWSKDGTKIERMLYAGNNLGQKRLPTTRLLRPRAALSTSPITVERLKN